jgi:plastocyanin
MGDMRKPMLLAATVAVTAVSITAIPALAATKSVTVKDNSFSPTSLTIKKGTKVKWTWKGRAPHNVTVTSGPVKFHSATQTSGSFSKKFSKKGTYTIVCTIHAPGMKMKVKVT